MKVISKTATIICTVAAVVFLCSISQCGRNSLAAVVTLAGSAWDNYLAFNHITWAGQPQFDSDISVLSGAVQSGSNADIEKAATNVAQDITGYAVKSDTEKQLVANIINTIKQVLVDFGITPKTMMTAGAPPQKMGAKEIHDQFVARWKATGAQPTPR